MSAPPFDDARARLNYFNGQRLAASDLRVEQGHHLGMRRVLNRSLYSPGVVAGLQVEPAGPDPAHPADKSWRHRVLVRHGLAFDHLGREIFLPTDTLVQVQGAPSTTPGEVFGNLLTISYREQRQHPVRERCNLGAGCAEALVWGAPTRIMADVVFAFLDAWPNDESGRVVLGQVELAKGCEVVRVLQGVRRYASPVKPQKVRAISLEGEKDVALGNAKLLHFHVDGGFPESASLYLRARSFSTLFYTELARHNHAIALDTQAAGFRAAHHHGIDLTTLQIGAAVPAEHRHEIWAPSDDGEHGSIDIGDDDDPTDFRLTGEGGVRGGRALMEVKKSGAHSHTVELGNVPPSGPGGEVPAHDHGVNGNTLNRGLAPGARAGPALSYVDDMRVLLDGQDVTALICSQLASRPGQAGNWVTLGDGSPNHALAAPEGSGQIDLLRLGVELGLGTHTLEFRVLQANVGGNLQYNLYVG